MYWFSAVVVLPLIATNPGWFLAVATLGPMTWKKSTCHVLIVTTCVFLPVPINLPRLHKQKDNETVFTFLSQSGELLGGFFVDTAHLYCSGITTSCTKYAPKNVAWYHRVLVVVRLRICHEKLFGDGNHFLGNRTPCVSGRPVKLNFLLWNLKWSWYGFYTYIVIVFVHLSSVNEHEDIVTCISNAGTRLEDMSRSYIMNVPWLHTVELWQTRQSF